MRHGVLLLAAVSLPVSSFASAQDSPPATPLHVEASAPIAGQTDGRPDRALMQKINDAWATLDPGNAAKYYDMAPENVFYDLAPLEYTGWSAYARGARDVLATLTSMKYTVADDAVVHLAGSIAWGTATLRVETVDKQGRKQVMDLRWTPVWQQKGASWLLVHEHL